MKIKSIHIRRFRSIEKASLTGCGGLNVLIGKNNAGKSNILSTIDLVYSHLRTGVIAGPWDAPRPQDEFNDRNTTTPIQIGVEFDLPASVNGELQTQLQNEAPHLGQSIEQIKSFDTIAFILAGAVRRNISYLFVEQITVGKVAAERDLLTCEGIPLLFVPRDVAEELFKVQQEAVSLQADLAALRKVDLSRVAPYLERPDMRAYMIREAFDIQSVSPTLRFQLNNLFTQSSTQEQLSSGVKQIENEVRAKIEQVNQKETTDVISAFAGKVRVAPTYAGWLMRTYGSMSALHLKETKQPIGREEATALLRLKIKRGGAERFAAIQQVVRALLGVSVDAFEAEQQSADKRSAEMDIDEFLAEANGAGVREALRLILDLELKAPKLVLVEEPEVHLHPGLEHAIYSYLREKSQDVQMFVTTHSTNFVDSISFQNIYLITRDANKKTHCETVDEGDGVLRIPSELGLRLSTVFMFDRLIFVEGPSDEAVLREMSKRLDIDLARANIEFVQMGGVRNFAHFAAEGTLDLLSRRRIKIRFVTDRDERGDEEVERMLTRLGDRARLVVLQRRELENYLLDPLAVLEFIKEKRLAAGSKEPEPSLEDVGRALVEEAQLLKDEVIRLRLEKRVLKSVHLQKRNSNGTIDDKIRAAVAELEGRLGNVEEERLRVEDEVNSAWPSHALSLVPGTLILAKATRRFGVGFNKESGDSARLARYISETAIPEDIRFLLTEISQLGSE